MSRGVHQGLADSELEHVAEELLELEDEDGCTLEALERVSRVPAPAAVVERLLARGLVETRGKCLRLTAGGRAMAESQLRRHRLAEVLLATVLEVADERTLNRTACVMEHILSPSVTDSVCAFLGHPTHCPHGKPIPPGRCCRSFSNAVEPLVQPLDRLGVGEAARIVYMVPRDPERLVRLSGLGVVPGATLRLVQRRPATVFAVGETTIAIDRAIAAEIYVKKLAGGKVA